MSNNRNWLSSIFSKQNNTNRIFRMVALLSLVTISSNQLLLFVHLASTESISVLHISFLILSFAGCLYFLFMIYYIKRNRERTSKINEEKYSSIIAVSGMGAWEYHHETKQIWCSPEYFKMLGYEEEEWPEQKKTIDEIWTNLIHPDDQINVINKFFSTATEESNTFHEETFRLKHKSGEWIWVLAKFKAMYRSNSKRSKILLGTHVDITEKIEIQSRLQKQNQKLVDFYFSNAHHVRGPVARILGLVELVKLDMETDINLFAQLISKEVEKLDEVTKSITRDLDDLGD